MVWQKEAMCYEHRVAGWDDAIPVPPVLLTLLEQKITILSHIQNSNACIGAFAVFS